MAATRRTPDDGACHAIRVHGERAAHLRPRLPDGDARRAAAERPPAHGDPARPKTLLALSLSQLCVCDRAALAGVSQTSASQRLQVPRASDPVRFRRQGRRTRDRLTDPGLPRSLAAPDPRGVSRRERRSA